MLFKIVVFVKDLRSSNQQKSPKNEDQMTSVSNPESQDPGRSSNAFSPNSAYKYQKGDKVEGNYNGQNILVKYHQLNKGLLQKTFYFKFQHSKTTNLKVSKNMNEAK